MCNAVFFRGYEYACPRQLATLVGGLDKLVWGNENPFRSWPADKDWHDLDLCLCPIDLEATLSKAGLKWIRGYDPMEWHIVDSKQNTTSMKAVRIHDVAEGGNVLAFDLRNILSALGPQADKATWRVGKVEGEFMVTGDDAADKLEDLARSERPIYGKHLRKISRHVQQTIFGEFRGYENASSTDPWIIVIAYDSSWFEVRSRDEAALGRLKAAFKDVRPIPSPPEDP
jgi:hypothetical protein